MHNLRADPLTAVGASTDSERRLALRLIGVLYGCRAS